MFNKHPFWLWLWMALCASAMGQAVPPAVPAPAPSQIFFTTDQDAISGVDENPRVSARMVDRLIMGMTGKNDIAQAWRTFVGPNDRVGIKVSTVGGRYFSTHLGVVEAIVAGLKKAGIPASHIIVWDRDADSLRHAQFVGGKDRYEVRSIPPTVGYDPKQELSAPVIGKLIWGDAHFKTKPKGKPVRPNDPPEEQISSESYLARVMGDVTKIINVPVLCDEAGCGIAGAFYNMTVPNLDNWRRFVQIDGQGREGIPEIYADPRISGKVVLHIMDGLMGQYAGGPSGNPNYAFAHSTLYASKDPVALDGFALRQIETWRAQAKLPPMRARVTWLQTAQDLELGKLDPVILQEIKAQ